VPSKVEICNMALDALGQTNTIADLTEQSKAARAFARHYDQVRQVLLACFPWPFATRSIALSAVADTFPGWQYVYAYPAGALRAWGLSSADGLRAYTSGLLNGAPWANGGRTVEPFSLAYGSAGQVITTDLADAWLTFTFDLPDGEGRFPPLFVDAMVWALAERVAMPITVEPAIMQNARDTAMQKLLIAQAESMNDGGPDFAPTTPSLAARY
jgi:hypothetical protein